MGYTDIFSKSLKELLWQINLEGGSPCAVAPELFFHEPFREIPAHEAIDLAKGLCRECPVAMECLKVALTDNIQDGIWGGFTAEERRRFKR